MTITLLSILVAGNTISLNLTDKTQTLVSRALEVTKKEAYEELESACGQSVKMEWLRNRFQGVTKDCGNEVITYSARSYLLYLFRCTLFTDKITSWVSSLPSLFGEAQ